MKLISLFTAGISFLLLTACPTTDDPVCGNGKIEGTELCDGVDFGERTCATYTSKHGDAYDNNVLLCTDDCHIDPSQCRYCGDGTLDADDGEECDRTDFNEQSCDDIWTQGGSVYCNSNCTVNYNECRLAVPQENDYNYKINDIVGLSSSRFATIGTAHDNTSPFVMIQIAQEDSTFTNTFSLYFTFAHESTYLKGAAITSDASDFLYLGTTTMQLGVPVGMDAGVTKMSTEGDVIWDLSIASANDEELFDIVEKNGDIFVVGHTKGDLEGTNLGNSDFFLSKITSDGTVLWTRQWGTSEKDTLSAVTADSEGNCYVSGLSHGLQNDGSISGKSGYTAMLDGDGNLIWEDVWGTTASDWASDITIDSNGNIYITGTTMGSFAGNEFMGGFGDVVMIKYNSSGERLLEFQTGSPFDDEGKSISIHEPTGRIYIAGYGGEAYSSDYESDADMGGGNISFTELNPQGDILNNIYWLKSGFETATSFIIQENFSILTGYISAAPISVSYTTKGYIQFSPLNLQGEK